ncbi:MAG: hypothetical protein ACRDID_15420 [Ktedonobacterales bacterium]
MSQISQTDDAAPQAGAAVPLSGLARAERLTTIAAIALAVIAAIFLYVSLFTEHEVCYGLRADHLQCQPLDVVAAERAALVLLYPGVLFAAAALGAFWHARATEPSSRSTAYGLTVSSVVVLIGIIVPALAGAGLYLLPATAVITATAVIATVKFIQDFRAGRAQRASAPYEAGS